MKVWNVLTLGIVCLTQICCGTKDTLMKQNMEEIRNVFRQDKAEIILKYNASGAGIGKRDEVYVIVVYVNPKTLSKPQDTHWKCIPLVFENIGEVRAQ